MISQEILNSLALHGVEFKVNYPLSSACTFKIGGFCSIAVFPKTEEQFLRCVDILDDAGIRVHICGKGSNTLFGDGQLDLAVVFTSGLDSIEFNGKHISCGAGVGLISLASKACDKGLSGLEFASGIPGSVGGAVYMNAGAYGSAMENVVVKSRAYDRVAHNVITVTEHSFGYRDSIYKQRKELVCIGVDIELCEGDTDTIKAKMREFSEQRRSKQPIEYPSAGSYFKRPEGDFAGRLIEVSGLKGTAVGGARVSEKHAGFIVNVGGASFDDVMRLEQIVKQRVLENMGVSLEREVEVIV